MEKKNSVESVFKHIFTFTLRYEETNEADSIKAPNAGVFLFLLSKSNSRQHWKVDKVLMIIA